MTHFEALLALFLVVILLLQIARRAKIPYPSMLALGGSVAAFVPGVPEIGFDPATTLALFTAPVLLEAASKYPFSTARLLWRPLLALGLGAVLASAAVVALIGWKVAGLPVAAAWVLGAIVAPPDAAAAIAVIGAVALPRRTLDVLKGESLFNDAVALLLFGAALTIQNERALHVRTLMELSAAAPGGLLLGIIFGLLMSWANRFVTNSLGGNLLQFLNAYVVWVVAGALHLSSVLAVVAFGMTVALSPRAILSPRMRLQSSTIWTFVVFALNILAFLMMGLQARGILIRLPPHGRLEAAEFTSLVVLAVIVTRLIFLQAWCGLTHLHRMFHGDAPAPTFGQVTVVGWSGMRGLVTLATAFALPSNFSQRDLVVLAAFAVVLTTLVLQGLTLAPLVRLLGVHRMENREADLFEGRRHLAVLASERLARHPPGHDLTLADIQALSAESTPSQASTKRIDNHRRLGLELISLQRQELQRMRDVQHIDVDNFYTLLEELDWRELALLPDADHIDQS